MGTSSVTRVKTLVVAQKEGTYRSGRQDRVETCCDETGAFQTVVQQVIALCTGGWVGVYLRCDDEFPPFLF